MGSKSEGTEHLRDSIVTYGEHYYTFDLGLLGVNKREREALNRRGRYFKSVNEIARDKYKSLG